MSDEGQVPRWRLNEVIAERDAARRDLATAQEASRAHALDVADWKAKVSTAEGKVTASKTRLTEAETAHQSALTLRDTHDALRSAGLSGQSHRDYFLQQVPEGKTATDYLAELRGMEKVDDSILADIVRVEAGEQQRPKTPGKPGGQPGKHTARTDAEWNKMLANPNHATLVAERDSFVATYPGQAGTYDDLIAAIAPPG